jgi:AraC-like DNA-binding protein
VVPPHYEEHAPAKALQRVVACYWTLTAVPGHTTHRVLPDGCLDILVDLSSGRAEVVGVMTKAIVSAQRRGLDLLGVRFQPGEAPSFFGLVGRDTRDIQLALPDVWGPFGRAFEGRITEARSTGDRRRLLDEVLLSRMVRRRAPDRRIRAAVDLVSARAGAIDVSRLATHVGLGERQLERAFDHHVGLGPKAFARVMRLQALVSSMQRAPRSFAALAADHGFSDQAHLVREVRALSGVTPGELFRERGAMSDSFNPSLGVE